MLILSLWSCDPYRRIPLSIELTKNADQYFRIDGVYYCTYNRAYSGIDKELTFYVIFYSSGYVYGVKSKDGDKKDLIKGLKERIFDQSWLDNVNMWGGFNIQNNTVIIQSWYGHPDGLPFRTRFLQGDIINDTTLLFYGLKDIDTLHFMYTPHIPDSIPPFVKRGE